MQTRFPSHAQPSTGRASFASPRHSNGANIVRAIMSIMSQLEQHRRLEQEQMKVRPCLRR